MSTFIGKDPDAWRSDLRTFSSVAYLDIYPGIDLIYRLAEGRLKYEFLLHPGADPDDIKVVVNGHTGISLAGSDLVLATTIGDILDSGLIAFYKDDPLDRVECRFEILSEDTFGFYLGDYDSSRDLVIDPLVFSTLFGLNEYDLDTVVAITTDGDLNPVLLGATIMLNVTATPGALNLTWAGGWSIYVAKLSRLDGSLKSLAFIGGGDYSWGNAIQVDQLGNIIVVGSTYSSQFPTTLDAMQQGLRGWSEDGIIFKMDRNCTELLYSSYFGGSYDDTFEAMYMAENGTIYTIGTTDSYDLPTTQDAFQKELNGSSNYQDSFLCRFSPDLREAQYVSYLGGSSHEWGVDISVDREGCVFLLVASGSYDFPTTPEAFREYKESLYGMAVARMEVNGSALRYSTFLSTIEADLEYHLTLDVRGRAVVVGRTDQDFYPTTDNAIFRNLQGEMDGLILVIEGGGRKLAFASYFGADGYDACVDVAFDVEGNMYIVGSTDSMNLTTTSNAPWRDLSGSTDAFLLKLDPDYSVELFTFIGGTDGEYGDLVHVPRPDLIYLSGSTASVDFPTTSGSYSTKILGDQDDFLMKLNFDDKPPVADAGHDIVTMDGDYFFLDGTGSLDNVMIENWTWSVRYPDHEITLFGPQPSYRPSSPGILDVRLHVRDEMYHESSDAVKVLVLGTSPDIEIDVGEVLRFVSIGSTEFAETMFWNWSFQSGGEDVRYETSSADHKFEVPGVFVVTLQVEDLNGNVVMDERLVRVRSRSGSVADAGEDFASDQNDPATFDGTGSIEGLMAWTWEFVDCDRIVRLEGQSPVYVFNYPGDFVVTLFVLDITGMKHTDHVQVHIRDTKPPVATCLIDPVINQDETLLLDGTPSTDNDRIKEWTWIFLYDGQTVVLSGEMQRFSFSIPGLYQIFLFVEDGAGNRAETNLTVEVLDITAPVANAGPPQTVSQHETVSLDGSGSTDNVAIMNWTWRYVYQRKVYELYGTYPSLKIEKAGVYRITLIVSDEEGLKDTHDTVITVEDHKKPIADAGPDLEIVDGDVAFFNGMKSSDDGGVMSWEWRFEYDDQTILFEGRLASFVFNAPGEYVVTLLVKDFAGNEDSDTVLVKVREAPESARAPWAWIVAAVGAVMLVVLATKLLILPRLKDGSKGGP